MCCKEDLTLKNEDDIFRTSKHCCGATLHLVCISAIDFLNTSVQLQDAIS